MSKQREWNLFERTGESAHDEQWEVVRDEKGVCLAIPDHPALPAVARWLVEHNDALVYGQHTPGDWIDVIGAYADETDDVMDRMLLTVSVIPALRSLIAALTEGQG